MTMPTAIRCPKCDAPMRAYERSGVTIDQCTECRGIFLDAGELQHLIAAEQAHYGVGGPGGPAGPGGPGGPGPGTRDDRLRDDRPRWSLRVDDDDDDDDDDRDRDRFRRDDRSRDDRGGFGQGRRRGSFLEDLLDFG